MVRHFFLSGITKAGFGTRAASDPVVRSERAARRFHRGARDAGIQRLSTGCRLAQLSVVTATRVLAGTCFVPSTVMLPVASRLTAKCTSGALAGPCSTAPLLSKRLA